MGIKEDAEKAAQAKKAQGQSHSAGKGMSAEQKAAMLKGTATENSVEVGKRAVYKPTMFPITKANGIEYLKDAAGSPTAPEVHGYPFDVTHHVDKQFGPYEMVSILLKSPTFVIDGREGEETEQVIEAGSVLSITLTKGLERVEAAARDKTHATECWIRPLLLKPIPGGKKTWEWSVRVGDKIERGKQLPTPTESAPQQLTNGTAAPSA